MIFMSLIILLFIPSATKIMFSLPKYIKKSQLFYSKMHNFIAKKTMVSIDINSCMVWEFYSAEICFQLSWTIWLGNFDVYLRKILRPYKPIKLIPNPTIIVVFVGSLKITVRQWDIHNFEQSRKTSEKFYKACWSHLAHWPLYSVQCINICRAWNLAEISTFLIDEIAERLMQLLPHVQIEIGQRNNSLKPLGCILMSNGWRHQ